MKLRAGASPGALDPRGGAASGPRRLAVRAAADGLGTAILLAAVVGSGISGERLAHGNAGLALLFNSLCTGAVLTALILGFRVMSGAHFNPAVTISEASCGRWPWPEVPAYVLGQVIGAFAGVATAHAMFAEPVFTTSRRVRSGFALAFAELVATAGLLLVLRGASRLGTPSAAVAAGAYIAGAYWFTSSTSFANPAVTLARTATDTFSGIRPSDAFGFVGAQLAAVLLISGVTKAIRLRETDVIPPPR